MEGHEDETQQQPEIATSATEPAPEQPDEHDTAISHPVTHSHHDVEDTETPLHAQQIATKGMEDMALENG